MPYVDNNHIEHESFEAACIYYGADTPASLAAEDAYFAAEEAIQWQDEMEAWGGQPPRRVFISDWDDVPF